MTTPPCVGKWNLFDSTNLADHQLAAQLCAACPMTQECRQRYEKARSAAYGTVPVGTWAGRLYGRPRTDERARVALEDAAYSDRDARAAHNAWNQGDRSQWARTGQRVWDRRYRRQRRAVSA